MRRGLIATAAALTAGSAMVAVTTPPGPVYSGPGWKASTVRPLLSIHPDPYYIVFADATARSILKPYFTGPAAQITAITGVPVVVTDILDTTPVGTCPGRHRIIVTYEHQPMGVTAYSQARPCYSIADNSAWGGHVRMDSEYWEVPAWFSTNSTTNETYRKNLSAHELAHIFGLDHPNEDHDGDGTVERFECVKNAAGWTPTQCSPNGGDRSATGAGKYVADFDAKGLKQMADNYWLRQGITP
ncbi:hypothetical protein EAO77_36130 [Streptomyces sp. t39]|nr:hypothetical protein EAO77_36130 [Streptomyces sp. t39]